MLLKTVCKTKKIFSFILAIVTLFSVLSVGVFALTDAEKQEYENQIDQIKEQIAANQQKIEELDKEAAQYDGEITALQSKIATLQQQIDLYNQEIALIDADIRRVDEQISSIEAEIESLNIQITEMDRQIVELEQEKADTYVLLGERIRASYMSGASTPLEFILTSDDFQFQVYLERVELLQRIAENDNNIIKQLENKIVEIGVKLAEIEDVKKRLNTKIAELDEAKAEYESKKQEQVDARQIVQDAESDIQKDLNKVMSIVNNLNAQSAQYQAAIEMREEAILDLEAKLVEKNTHYGSGVTGDMVWPLPYDDAYVSSSFKERWGRRHNGIDTCRWAGTHGADIISVKSGTVEEANWGWGGGYGNYVVVNHGEGVLTYYAHLSNITVSVGQSVRQGDVIGQAGNTGYSFGAHLHFGLMINGSWVNPVNYLTRYTPGGKYIEATD